MREIIIDSSNSNIRLDKFLQKYMSEAPSSFIYKMLRKKNITLNKKKSLGSEILKTGDCINLFLSDDTINKFSSQGINPLDGNIDDIDTGDIIYEDKHILLYHKRVGLLSQKAKKDDVSANEIVLNYLLKKKECDFSLYKPSVINRLDRNTEGIIIIAKTYLAANVLSNAIKERLLHKYYYCIVKGKADDIGYCEARLEKNNETNVVFVHPADYPSGDLIKTNYRCVKCCGNLSLLEVELITGKSHQIRAHLASLHHPIVGDYKYGDRSFNDKFKKKYGINYQLLFAKRIVMPKLENELAYLSNNTFEIKTPDIFEEIMNYGNLEIQRS